MRCWMKVPQVNTLALGIRTAEKVSASHRSNSWLPTTLPLCDLCDLCAMLFPLRLILAQPPPGHRSNSWLPPPSPLCDLCGLCAMLFPLRLILAQPPPGHRSHLLTLNSYRFQPSEHRLLGFHGQEDDEADANRQQPVPERDRR
jgi:hypothetical protein